MDWMVDSGATVHLVNDLTLMHNPMMNNKPKSLIATSNAKGNIVATGSECLLNQSNKVLWLHDVYERCVPTATSS